MKILIVNQPLNNRGDESAHKALLRSIVKAIPQVEIIVLFIGMNNDSIRQFNVNLPQVKYVNLLGEKNSKRAKLFLIRPLQLGVKWLWYLHPTILKVMSYYRWANYVVCAPGGICMGGFQNWPHLSYLHLAKYLDKPLLYFGRSFGPFPTKTFKNRRFKAKSLEIIRYFSFCSIRDSKTEDIAKDINIDYVPTVDTAFLDMPHVEIPDDVKKIFSGKPYVVFVPNLLIWHYAYKKYTKNQVMSLYSKMLDIILKNYPHHKIIMLPQTFNFGTYLGDDYPFFCDLKNYVNSQDVEVIPDIYSSDIQQTIISHASCLIGARYHSVVFAINQNIPFIALSYEHKISGLLNSLGDTDSMIDITKVFENEDNEKKCLEDFSIIISKLSKRLDANNKAKKIALNGFEEFIKTIKTYSK